jgi:hypothetical protein
MNYIQKYNKIATTRNKLLAVVPAQLKFSIVKDHNEPTILLFETLFCMWECFNMGTELPAKVMLGEKLVLMQMTFLNNIRKVGRLALSRTSCFLLCSEKKKGKVIPLHAMGAHGGRGGMAPTHT